MKTRKLAVCHSIQCQSTIELQYIPQVRWSCDVHTFCNSIFIVLVLLLTIKVVGARNLEELFTETVAKLAQEPLLMTENGNLFVLCAEPLCFDPATY